MNEKKKSVKTEIKLEMTQLSLPITQTEEAKEMAVESSVTSATPSAVASSAGGAVSEVDTGRDFEEALLELEKVVSQLEGEVKLEEALQLFDRGMKLSKSCEGILKNAEKKIEILKRAVDGSLSTEAFNEDSLQIS